MMMATLLQLSFVNSIIAISMDKKVLYLFRRTDTFLPHLAFVDFDLPLTRHVKTDARSPPVELSNWPHQESCPSVTRTHCQQQRKHCIGMNMC